MTAPVTSDIDSPPVCCGGDCPTCKTSRPIVGWKNPAPDASPVRSPTDSVTMQIGETGGTDELVERAARAMCEYDVKDTDDPRRRAAVEWSQERGYYRGFAQVALAEAAASLAAEKAKVAHTKDQMDSVKIDRDHERTRREALEQRVAALVGQEEGWQPIETLPTEETIVEVRFVRVERWNAARFTKYCGEEAASWRASEA